MVLDGLSRALGELVGLDPQVLADGETVIGLHRQLNRLQALVTLVAARFETGGEWQLDGSRTAASWLMTHCRIPKPVAKATLARARALRHLPSTEAAWLSGDITISHVRTLAEARRPATAEHLARDESILVDQAKSLQFRHFAKAVAYWRQLADANGEDDRACWQHADRRCHLSQTYQASWVLDAQFDPLSGAVVAEELFRLEDEMFRSDWAVAKAELGREPTIFELSRSPQQRRADAMVEMATRSRSTPPGARRPEPLFTVLIGWETLSGRICELADGTIIAPGALLPWLDRALLQRVVFKAPSRVIDVGFARRLFQGATRRAVEVRDRECFHPSCDAPAPQCQADHIIPYIAGGPTTQDNGRLACGFHNRQRHKPPPDP